MNKTKALLFGLNYSHCQTVNHLNGCINDVLNMSEYLTTQHQIPCEIYTDESDDTSSTTKEGMKQKLLELAELSNKDALEFVFIHYSGHGSYVRDISGDERDGDDECIVPSDCEVSGYLLDDEISDIIAQFNPNTRIVCIFDSCHSGTVCDVKYSWESCYRVRVENILCKIPSKVLTISGCLDTQTSADAYIADTRRFAGALTNSLLKLLKSNEELNNDVFKLIDVLRVDLKNQGFEQIPKLCSTYNLARNKRFIG